MRAVGFGIAAAAACLVLAGCGTTDPSAPPGRPGATTATVLPIPTDPSDLPTPTGKPSPPDPSLPGPTPGRLTLTGTVEPGVEGGCLLLGGYLLLGGPRPLLSAGRRVTVTGHVQPSVVSTCQQGIPLVVETAKPA